MKIIGLTKLTPHNDVCYKVLVEMNPGFRTLLQSCVHFRDGHHKMQNIHYHLKFPWMYFQMNLQYYNNRKLFTLYHFESYLSHDKAKKSTVYLPQTTARYSIYGERIYFHNTHPAHDFDNPASGSQYAGIVPCYGDDVVYPANKNLYDSVNWYLSEFLEIPFSSRPLLDNIESDQIKIKKPVNYSFDCEHSNSEDLCKKIWR